MAIHSTTSYAKTPSTPIRKWNPSKVLGIVNTDPGYQGITCIGYAPSQRRRCRNPIRVDNRCCIEETLDEISYLHPGSQAVVARLREIAGLALCVRYHQSQQDAVLRGWVEKMKELNVGEERSNIKSRKTKVKQEIDSDDDTKDLDNELREAKEMVASMKKMLAELQAERLASQMKSRKKSYKQRLQEESDEEETDEEETDEETDEETEEEEREREERERRERRRQERKRQEKKREKRERKDKEREDKEREDKEREDKERRRQEREKKAREQREREEKEREEQQKQRATEQAARNERIRQRAQKVQEEREREKREKAQQERATWDRLWTDYQVRWESFTACKSRREGDLGDVIPWPVEGGLKERVDTVAVKKFMEMARPRDASVEKVMRNESRKWHPDAVKRWLGDAKLAQADQERVDLICRVVTDLLNGAAGRASEFHD